jgi:hypothetical protein
MIDDNFKDFEDFMKHSYINLKDSNTKISI